MSDTLIEDRPTVVEQAAVIYEIGAVPVAAFSGPEDVTTFWGDGQMRVFRPGAEAVEQGVHSGAILCATQYGDTFFTGGDDGVFARTTNAGTEQIARFPRKWVDNVAAGAGGIVACSVGKAVHVFQPNGRTDVLEHSSTVGGIAFDRKGSRLAVAHYGGVTLWSRETRKWKSSSLKWAGSHVAVTWSPDDRFVITVMQENALHGWRMKDKAPLRMHGYPTKVKGWAWTGTKPWLATTGAGEAILWPFEGINGPMGIQPLQVCSGDTLVTSVLGLPGHEVVLAGFADGCILFSETQEIAEAKFVKRTRGPAIETLGVATEKGWLFAADDNGRVHWMPLV